MVGVPSHVELVHAGKILKCLEVLCYGSRSGIEYGTFNVVRVACLSIGHKMVALSPGEVSYVAGLVRGHDVMSLDPFCTCRSAVRKHIVVNQIVLRHASEVEITLLAGVGIENGG